MVKSLGLIETIGFSAAISALDAASKAADVKLIGCERVIGVGGAVSVTVKIEGDVASVQAGVEAGVKAANKVGKVASYHVIPRPQDDVMHFVAGSRGIAVTAEEGKGNKE